MYKDRVFGYVVKNGFVKMEYWKPVIVEYDYPSITNKKGLSYLFEGVKDREDYMEAVVNYLEDEGGESDEW